jgi:hypothetical protein
MSSTKRGRRSKRSQQRTEQQEVAFDLMWNYSWRDQKISETIWTSLTTQAMEKELKEMFGYVEPCIFQEDGLSREGEVVSSQMNHKF